MPWPVAAMGDGLTARQGAQPSELGRGPGLSTGNLLEGVHN